LPNIRIGKKGKTISIAPKIIFGIIKTIEANRPNVIHQNLIKKPTNLPVTELSWKKGFNKFSAMGNALVRFKR